MCVTCSFRCEAGLIVTIDRVEQASGIDSIVDALDRTARGHGGIEIIPRTEIVLGERDWKEYEFDEIRA